MVKGWQEIKVSNTDCSSYQEYFEKVGTAKRWCEDQPSTSRFSMTWRSRKASYFFYFKNPQDAMMFKLAWG